MNKAQRLALVRQECRESHRIVRYLTASLGIRAASAIMVESTAWMDSAEMAEILQGRIDASRWVRRG